MADHAAPDAPMEIESVAEDIVMLTEDGGVTKKILTPGSSDECPENGDEVYVHYVGTLTDGTKFDSSRDRGDLFSFKLGEGRVIKGWDVGVASMKKGEKAILTCTSEYAYGAQGSPPKIPGGATLNFEVELFRWDSHKDISGDGGVLKDVIKTDPDAGYEMPSGNDEITVKYKVCVAGSDTVVAESPEAGVTFAMSAPGGAVLPGVLKAVETMKPGEVARLTLSPAYGYGDAGLPPSVPGGATLTVDVELAGCVKVEEMTKDGGIVRRIVQAAKNAWKTPGSGTKTVLTYKASLADGTVFDEASEVEYTLDEGDLLPEGMCRALMGMKEGERDVVTLQPGYAFGEAEHKGKCAPVPAGSVVTYDITLCKFEAGKEAWDMSDEEKVAAAADSKERGNAAFKAGLLERAARCYERATSAISYDKTFPDEAKAAARDVRKACHLNLAAVRTRQARWGDAIDSCNKVLEADPDNLKALFRRAQGFLGQQDFLEAELDIKRGLCIEPESPDLLSLSKRLKAAQKALNKKESALYGKMFSKPAATAAPAPAGDADTKQAPDADAPVEQPAAA